MRILKTSSQRIIMMMVPPPSIHGLRWLIWALGSRRGEREGIGHAQFSLLFSPLKHHDKGGHFLGRYQIQQCLVQCAIPHIFFLKSIIFY